MRIALNRLIPLLAIALIFSACSDDNNKIGSTVKGTRISIMEDAKTINADKDIQGQHPQISEPIANRSWPEAGYDSAHVLPNADAPEHPTIAWTSSIGEGSDSNFKLLARPVIADNRIFTMDAQGTITAFDIKDGDSIWDFDTTPEDSDVNAIGGGLAIEGGILYATTGFGEVIALNAADGKVKWRHSVMNPIRAAPTVAGGRVYAVTIDNQLQALNAETGESEWHHDGIAESATLMGASNPAVSGDSVVIAYSSGEIYNLRAENGRASWNYTLATPTQVGALPAIADIRGLPIIDHGQVYAISHSGRMAAIDHRTGDRAWEIDIGGINTPVVSGDTVFILSNDDQLIAIARESGRILWVQGMQHREDPTDPDSDKVFWAGPVLAHGHLWLTNSIGQLASFSTDDGKPITTVDLENPSFIPPVVANGMIYVVTDNGELVALR